MLLVLAALAMVTAPATVTIELTAEVVATTHVDTSLSDTVIVTAQPDGALVAVPLPEEPCSNS